MDEILCTLLQTDNHISTPSQMFYGPDALSDLPTNGVKALNATKGICCCLFSLAIPGKCNIKLYCYTNFILLVTINYQYIVLHVFFEFL